MSAFLPRDLLVAGEQEEFWPVLPSRQLSYYNCVVNTHRFHLPWTARICPRIEQLRNETLAENGLSLRNTEPVRNTVPEVEVFAETKQGTDNDP